MMTAAEPGGGHPALYAARATSTDPSALFVPSRLSVVTASSISAAVLYILSSNAISVFLSPS